MKKLLNVVVSLLMVAGVAVLAPSKVHAHGIAVSLRSGVADPSTCRPSGLNIFVNRNSTSILKICTADDTWTSLATLSGGTFTGPVLLSNGTAAAPSLGFSSDSDGSGTGIFRSAANSIGFTTNGVERWVINASGSFNCATDGGCDIGNGLADPRDLSLKRNLVLRGSTSGKITFAAGATTTDYTFTWPSTASGSPGSECLGANGTWLACGGGGGAGDVVGPASATDTAVAAFDGTTGKLLRNSSLLVDASGNVEVPAAATLSFGGNLVSYINGTGPRWTDNTTGFRLSYNVQSLSANRTYTAPNATGTMIIGTAVGTTVGAAGGASALPATPTGYLTIVLPDGSTAKIPYYTP